MISCNLSALQIANSLCPHHVSHYLGMDVHDVRTISKNIRLEPGMVITVEPGKSEHCRLIPFTIVCNLHCLGMEART